MLEKKITYTDFNGAERTETFRFNLNKAEILEMELGTAGGLTQMIEKLVEINDYPQIVKLYKNFILSSYGEKSLDGKQFIKSAEIRDKFEQSGAYEQLFMELLSDPEKASAFVNGVMPKVPGTNGDHEKPELKLVEASNSDSTTN